MSEMINYTIKIEKELVDKFKISLQLKKEDETEVASRLIRQYIIESFDSELRGMTKKSNIDNIDTQYGKALSRIPKWAVKPNQNNHKILKAFFLSEENGIARKDRMHELCSNESTLFVRDFYGNFTSMCTDAGKSHGKVFEVENDGTVTLWDEIKEVALEHKHYFI